MLNAEAPKETCATCKHSTPHKNLGLPTGFYCCGFGPKWKLRSRCDIERWERVPDKREG